MFFIVDLIIIGIMALCILIGYKRGLIGVAFKIIAFILSVVITFILYIPVSNFIINNTEIDDTIKNVIVEKISEKEETEEIEKSVDKENSMPEVITDYIDETTTNVKNSSMELVAENISITLVKFSVAVLLFIVVRILLMFIKLFTNIVEKLPIIKQFNKAGGIVFGVLEGAFIIMIGLAIILVVSSVVEIPSVIEAINNSFIGSVLYNNNLLLKLIF